MQTARLSFGRVAVAALLSTGALVGPASAQGLTEAVGDVGLTLGYNDISNQFSSDGRSAGVGFAAIDGSFTFRVAPRVLLGFDAGWRWDDVTSDGEFDFFGAPESQTVLAGRVLFDLSQDTRLGGFVAYGDTKMQGLSADDSFDYWLVGVEARHFVNDDMMIFGQIGVGDDDQDDGLSDGEGFNAGRVLRLGGTYFAGERSAFTLDVEYATADPYIDNSDAGEFFGVTLSGETRLATAAPWMVTYSLRADRLDATTENVSVTETTLGIGIRYVFGADSPREAARAGRSIGTPFLPARASIWTVFHDD